MKRKNVKNINVRIKSDGVIYVSASPFVPKAKIEAFLFSKAPFVLHTLEKYAERKEKPAEALFTEEELKATVLELCRKVYPYYGEKGIKYPEIRFRKMVSQWGNCRPKRGILTFSTNLCFAPLACIEYVVFHEFTHFLVADHSPSFYRELEKVFPLWKTYRKRLKEIKIQ